MQSWHSSKPSNLQLQHHSSQALNDLAVFTFFAQETHLKVCIFQKNVVTLQQKFSNTLKQEEQIMARPIRETPILYGKNAERFMEHMRQVDNMSIEERKENSRKIHERAARLNMKFIFAKDRQ